MYSGSAEERMNAIEVSDLRKTFTTRKGRPFRKKRELVTAVDGVSFSIREGEIFSLLGPNGAGKTTCIKMLATLLVPTSGSATVLGHDVVRDESAVRRAMTAVLPGERTLFWKLTVRENLHYFGALYGVGRKFATRRIAELSGYFGIDDKLDTLVEKLSTGQRQKVVLSRALLPDPSVILLDEPTLGLDPNAATALRTMIRQIRDQGKTILLTTHYMYEADELSDRVAIINKGRIACLDTPDALKRGLDARRIIRAEVSGWSGECEARFPTMFPGAGSACDHRDGLTNITIKVRGQDILVGDLGRLVTDCGGMIRTVTVDDPSLEDVFIAHTGDRLETSNEGVEHAIAV
jgi:ABC-2 type transport system ATP-binding protein